MIKKLVSHLGEYKRAAVLTPLFAALEAVMDVLLPTIMAFIIDQGIEKGDMNAILKYGLLTFLVAVVALALGVLAGKYAAEASTGGIVEPPSGPGRRAVWSTSRASWPPLYSQSSAPYCSSASRMMSTAGAYTLTPSGECRSAALPLGALK